MHIHWRRFRLADIPLESLEVFDSWLKARWDEKDELLAEHARQGHFPSSLDGGKSIVTEVKLGHWTEVWRIGEVLGMVTAIVVILRRIFV